MTANHFDGHSPARVYKSKCPASSALKEQPEWLSVRQRAKVFIYLFSGQESFIYLFNLKHSQQEAMRIGASK